MTPQEYLVQFPNICEPGRSDIQKHQTMEDWWNATSRPDHLLSSLSRFSPTVQQGYICADLAIGWAADALDLAGIPHGLRDLAPITDRETARQAETIAAEAQAAARATWAAAAEARAADAAEMAAEAARVAAWAAAAEARAADAAEMAARAAFCAINTGPDPVKMADQIRARIACPYKEIEL